MELLQLLVSGTAQGCIYGLIALGFVLIYKATETVSFAQGDLMMLGAFGGFIAMSAMGLPFWAAAIGTVLVMTAIGIGLERVVVRPILGQPVFSIIMLVVLTLLLFVIKKLVLARIDLADEVERQHNIGIAAVEMAISIAIALILTALMA